MNYTDSDIQAIVETVVRIKNKELQNILDELEKWLENKIELLKKETCLYGHLIDETVSEEIGLKKYIYQEVLEKLNELKGDE